MLLQFDVKFGNYALSVTWASMQEPQEHDMDDKKNKQFRKYCSVCNTSSKLLSYHIFPKDFNRRKQWCTALKIDSEVLKTKYTYVCSNHFKDTDYMPSASISNRNLKRNVVPCIETVITRASASATRAIEDNCKIIYFEELNHGQSNTDLIIDRRSDEQCDTVSKVTEDITDPWPRKKDHSYYADEIYKVGTSECITCTDYTKVLCENHDLRLENKSKNSIISDKEKEILALNISLNTIKSQNISHTMFIFEDESVKYYTGFINYTAFTAVFDFILPSGNVKDIIYKNANENVSRTQVCKLNAKDQFFLFLIKIRRDFDYKHISFLFNISTATACRVFQNWLYMSYFRLGSLNIWPHRNIILANAPKHFKENFPRVIASIDCTELYIESPSSLHRQSQCYSNYKSNTTLKGLIAIDPRGGIIFVSELYTGSISDVKIISESGFVTIIKNKLKIGEICAGDVILADKGFNVGDILEPVKLNMPSFKSSVTPFSDVDISKSREIASARVHVERVIRQIKTFKILKNIKITQCGGISQIWTVCALLCNFMNPVVTDNEKKQTNLCTVQLVDV